MSISKERSAQSAVEAVAGNEDLVREILLRLPVKSLLRFESVSKKWLSLISDPHFAQSYAIRRHNPHSKPSGLLLNHEPTGFHFVPFNNDGDGDEARLMLSHPDDPGTRIFQSCNGLLLCSSSIFSYREPNKRGFQYYICNPTTKQFTPLRFPTPEFGATLVRVDLAFDPWKSPHYKLISIRELNEETSTYQIDIYSSETCSWRNPAPGDPFTFTAPPEIALGGPVYCNGAIHWYCERETSFYFDMDTERLKPMPMPPFHEGFDFHYIRYFAESRGHLHLIVTQKPSPTEFDIWELKTDYSGWFVRYHVNLDAVTITFPDITWSLNGKSEAFSVLFVDRAEKEEESTLVVSVSVSGKAISFNLKDKTSKKLCDLVPCHRLGGHALDYDWVDAYQYIESLFRV